MLAFDASALAKHDVSAQMAIALAYVNVFNTGDMDSFSPLLSDELRHRTHPLALGRPFRTKPEYISLLKGYSNWLQVRSSYWRDGHWLRQLIIIGRDI